MHISASGDGQASPRAVVDRETRSAPDELEDRRDRAARRIAVSTFGGAPASRLPSRRWYSDPPSSAVVSPTAMTASPSLANPIGTMCFSSVHEARRPGRWGMA